MKRAIDIFFSIFGIIILMPFLLITVIISSFAHGFPILFLDSRLGINGRPFTLIKLRSMENGISKNAEHDITRITKWGRFLRQSSIDELPVLINVIKGDMSLVGPRPLPEKYLNRFNKIQKKRLEVKPGITGLAQIKGRNYLSWEERFYYDIEYIKKQSLILDIKIIFSTIILVIKGIGVGAKDQEIMPEFMGKKNNESSNRL
tara:strand:- start:288 stop:896 length:609 start_codon:yes stop_codon:yes gene_type:complete